MKTPHCQAADDTALAIPDDVRKAIHEGCSGGWINAVTQNLHQCFCVCHIGKPLVTIDEGPFPVLDPDEGPGADQPTEAPKKGTKSPPTVQNATNRRCEHCGEPCRARFLPGHDAKLKSMLAADALDGSSQATAELIARGWLRLVKTDGLSRETLWRAKIHLSHESPEDLIQRRVAERRGAA